jgi:hypothetical protein
MSDKITIAGLQEFVHYLEDETGEMSYPENLDFSLEDVIKLALDQHEEIASLRAQLAERDAILAECESIREAVMLLISEFEVGEISATEFEEEVRWQVDLLSNLPTTAQANAKIIAAEEEQERALYISGTDAELRQHYLEACYRTDQAVREKKDSSGG